MEAMVNVMQATFVTLQSSPTHNGSILLKGHQLFLALFSKFFNTVR